MQIQSNKSIPWPDEQSAVGQKTRVIISLSRFRFPLSSKHTSVCKARGANPFRSYTIKASLTLARLATAWPFSWLTSQTITSWRQGRKARLAWSTYTQIFWNCLAIPLSSFHQRWMGICCPKALSCFGNLWHIPWRCSRTVMICSLARPGMYFFCTKARIQTPPQIHSGSLNILTSTSSCPIKKSPKICAAT